VIRTRNTFWSSLIGRRRKGRGRKRIGGGRLRGPKSTAKKLRRAGLDLTPSANGGVRSGWRCRRAMEPASGCRGSANALAYTDEAFSAEAASVVK